MSGVFGLIDSQRRLDIRLLVDKMAASMCHRDWFVAERHVDSENNIALGRIGIGIFNKRSQPVWNANRTVALVMAGEFYNQTELYRNGVNDAKSDEQLALALYEQKGDSFASLLKGAFVIAIWDKVRQKLIITNDRFGLYPLFYVHHAGCLVFAPEMKGVLFGPNFPKKLDLTALAEYIRFQHILGDKTFFEDLKLLANASLLIYDLQTDCLTLKPYWNFAQIPQLPAGITFEEAAEEAGRLLKQAMTALTGGSFRLGVYLSAGVDSRVILGLIDQDCFPITTITFGQRGCRDVKYAEQLAAKVGTNHHYFEFVDGRWVAEFADYHLELTEGFHSWIHSHGISILEQVKPLLEVNLSGFAGAEINWEDYPLLHAPDDIAFTNRMFYLLCQETTWPSIQEAEAKLLFSSQIYKQVNDLAFESFQTELDKYKYLPYERRAAAFSRLNPDRKLFQYYTVFHRSTIELRFPFCDYGYTDFIYALPPEMLFKRKLRRAVILNLMHSLASIPYDKDDLPITNREISYLLAKLTQKSKSTINRYVAPFFPKYVTLYADYENWLRRELREWGENILLGERTLQRGIFNPDFLQSLWRRHQSGLEVNMIGKIAPLMTYEMMLRRFYDASS